MPYTPGIDVSNYEGDIEWSKVAAAGYRFAVLRATVGDYYTDPRFYSYWTDAKAAGLIVSAYHVLVATRYAEKQIGRLFNVLGSRRTDFPLILDVERDDGVSNAALTACVQDCLRLMQEKDGRRPLIYTAHYFWRDHILTSPDWSKYDLWVANYNATTPLLPPGWTTWKFWQYSPNGKVPGISSDTDLNWFNGSYADLQAYAAGTTPDPQPESVPLKARVTATRLNVRSGAGVAFKVIGKLDQGSVLPILNLGGRDVWVEFAPGKWSACIYGGKPFMEVYQPPAPETGLRARVIVDGLNIRSGPAITYADIGDQVRGAELVIRNIGGRDAWVQHDLGKWSAFAYGGERYMQIVEA
ncbi:MAG: hypothetical protein HPY45_14755 [Anaerolineae bacterium]|nr:hypothetical protein [Anaerolineae bacterium]